MHSWLELEQRFRALEDSLSHLRLDTQTGGGVYSNRLAGMSMASRLAQQFDGLVKVAGVKLQQTLPSKYSQWSPIDAWWEAVGEFVGYRAQRLTPAWTEKEDGTREYYYMRQINNIVSECANLSLDLHSTHDEQANSMSGAQINYFNGQFGYLNVGDIRNVESISVHVSDLVRQNQTDIAEALKQITNALDSESDLTDEQKGEALEQVAELARQATIEPTSRSSKGVIKAIATGLGQILSAAGGTAEIWTTWGDAIRAFFGF